jgi:cell wall-associated NlpC family hydrolase
MATPAWVQVSVATVWVQPSSPRQLDIAALRDPPRIENWLHSLDFSERLGLNGRVATQVLLGDKVLILSQRATWSRVEVPSQTGSRYPNGIVGWIPTAQLNLTAAVAGNREVVITTPSTQLFAVVGGTVGTPHVPISYGTDLPLLGETAGYDLVGLPGGTEGAVATRAARRVVVGAVTGTMIVAEARRFLGLAYLWGGTSGFGYDCSGLVYAVFARFGLTLPRDAADQQHAGTAVPLNQLQPGDLLFFAGPGGHGTVEHVGIYAGAGRMIDAPHTGAAVELIPMAASPVWPNFAGAVRAAGIS